MIFAELLNLHLTAAGMSVSQLARESGLPRRTIANWLEGYAHRPRYWNDVLRLAATLKLDRIAVDELLASAGFPTTATLRARYPDHMLLQLWNGSVVADSVGRRVVEIIGESGVALFQDLPLVKAVYLLEQATVLAETLGDTRYSCHLMLDLARCLIALMRYEAAAQTLYKALAIAEREKQQEVALDARLLLLSIHTRLNQSELDAHRRQLEAILRSPISGPTRVKAWHGLALWATHIGRYDEAACYYECILTDEDSSSHRLVALNNLSDLAIRREDYAEADRLLAHASKPSPYIHANRGLARMRMGDFETAEHELSLGVQLASACEDQRALLTLHLDRAELALRRCDESCALEAFQAALTLCNEEPIGDVKPVLSYCLDRLNRGQGKYLLTDPYYRASVENLV